ncbi:thiamine phosphate synthase [Campylobacter novaezeelandiae]|uniref:Thiamine-phosphate synthase n=1 Tax=Campylobacter novaezeelandiae TaxID=2267891 RepID=A0A4Q9JTF2_9BACT|nr:thiamine phosphate synthase [Campylobacter novaezeelandiae]QWU80390.1 thiamine phosphate synthase (TMP-TENI domain) [Campylobacter novaezeelandiae]TBR77934.1 thiamine phosphate synthase [Campylobacter novaezeelandiae]TBR78190.1 thiamine phosphate synthase [Campylobacter novaezeelandiae]TBR79661.1 thiamine phosphate synthase [Campylobacter novaezeelandiae]TBR81190.1 thiamine phosphate synthase [Campylobacter novaezeelandiae]
MIDLSLYLVASKQDKSDETFLNTLEQAIRGGVGIIQLREKELSARKFFELAFKVKKLCDAYCIPLIINDRLDIALALDASGVHLGQEDLDIKLARKILGKDKIIGLSLQKIEQLKNIEGANYLGCGAINSTPTKKSEILSLEILEQIITLSKLPVVAIGGIDETNVLNLKGLKLSGIAVVRAIMCAKDPFLASKNLRKLFKSL